MTLQNAHRSRLLLASTTDTWTLPTNHKVIVKIQGELENYKSHISDLKTKQDEDAKKGLAQLGPPTAGLVLALLEGLGDSDVGGRLKQQIKEY